MAHILFESVHFIGRDTVTPNQIIIIAIYMNKKDEFIHLYWGMVESVACGVFER